MFARMKPMILHVLFVVAPVLFFFLELKCSEKEQFLPTKEILRTWFSLRILCFLVSLVCAARQGMGVPASHSPDYFFSVYKYRGICSVPY